MKKMVYRYYIRKSPEHAVATVKRLIESGRIKPHEIVTVRGNFGGVRKWYRLTIRTAEEQFQFTSLGWFYHGNGSLSLQKVLRWLLVPVIYQDAILDIQYHGESLTPNCFVIPPVGGRN